MVAHSLDFDAGDARAHVVVVDQYAHAGQQVVELQRHRAGVVAGTGDGRGAQILLLFRIAWHEVVEFGCVHVAPFLVGIEYHWIFLPVGVGGAHGYVVGCVGEESHSVGHAYHLGPVEGGVSGPEACAGGVGDGFVIAHLGVIHQLHLMVVVAVFVEALHVHQLLVVLGAGGVTVGCDAYVLVALGDVAVVDRVSARAFPGG